MDRKLIISSSLLVSVVLVVMNQVKKKKKSPNCSSKSVVPHFLAQIRLQTLMTGKKAADDTYSDEKSVYIFPTL